MRILFLVCCATPHDEKFVRSMSAAGHDVCVFSFHWKPMPEGLASLPGVVIERVELRFAPRLQRLWPVHLVPRLRRVIRAFRPDVIHGGNTWNESYLAALSGFHLLLVMPYGSDVLLDSDRSIIFRHANRVVFKNADWVACDAQHLKTKLVNYHKFPADRISIFPKGIEVDAVAALRSKHRDEVRAALGWSDAYVLALTRNHEAVYDVPTFLRAFERLIAKDKRYRALIAGSGSLTAELKAWVHAHGLDPYVNWQGKLQHAELLRVLQGADQYVSTSLSDGTSVSLLEAMASALPVTVTDVPSNLEWITPGHNGEVVPRGDDAALALAIERTASAPAAAVEYGKRNLSLARDRGDWQSNYTALENLYRSLSTGNKA